MIEIFEKVKIRYVFLWYILILIACVILGEIIKFDNDAFIETFMNVTIVFVILLMIKRNGDKLRFDFSIFKRKEVRREVIKLVVINMLISIGALLILTRIIYAIDPIDKEEILSETPLVYNVLFNFILGVIIAPVLEEFVFRGVIFSRLSKRFGLIAGMVLSSFIFAVGHIKMNIIGAFVCGLIACILFKKYNNILVNISMHFLNNFILMITSLIPEEESASAQISSGDLNVMLIVGIALLIPNLILFIKYLRKSLRDIKTYDNNRITEAI